MMTNTDILSAQSPSFPLPAFTAGSRVAQGVSQKHTYRLQHCKHGSSLYRQRVTLQTAGIPHDIA